MIKDLSQIRELLIDYSEVEMPYDFSKGCSIQYITCSLDDEGNISHESFFPNFTFIRKCNDILILKNDFSEKHVPICRRDKGGNIIYRTRFFICDNEEKKEEDSSNTILNQELKDKISYQQDIIDKLALRVTEVELEKHELTETMNTYEDLLQEGRFKLKELSIQLRQKTEKIDHYEELIPKLYNSRSH